MLRLFENDYRIIGLDAKVGWLSPLGVGARVGLAGACCVYGLPSTSRAGLSTGRAGSPGAGGGALEGGQQQWAGGGGASTASLCCAKQHGRCRHSARRLLTGPTAPRFPLQWRRWLPEGGMQMLTGSSRWFRCGAPGWRGPRLQRAHLRCTVSPRSIERAMFRPGHSSTHQCSAIFTSLSLPSAPQPRGSGARPAEGPQHHLPHRTAECCALAAAAAAGERPALARGIATVAAAATGLHRALGTSTDICAACILLAADFAHPLFKKACNCGKARQSKRMGIPDFRMYNVAECSLI